MKHLYLLLLLISCISNISTQSFTEESPYMILRFMDLKSVEWRPQRLDELEQIIDDELKYSDAKKGTECKSIDFEQEAGYPKESDRFLDLSIRGLCTDDEGKVHPIDKELIIVAIERKIKEVNALVGATVYRVGHVQIFKYNRNVLNLIIIPISLAFIILLMILTFVLRQVRAKQKRRHIIAKLEEKKGSSVKKGSTTTPNIDPHANETQSLLQLDPTVVGNASDTLGSPKEFTHEPYSSPTRGHNREYQGGPPPIPSKENRPPYFNRDDETPFQQQRSNRSSRERMYVPYENEPRFSSNQYEPQHPDMIPMHEQQPRVVVRTIQDDGNHPSYNQQFRDPSTQFVPIPVQVERSGPHQRNVQPPYHSDPHYRNVNS